MGQAYVDRLEDAQVFLLEVGPFAYLAGDPGVEAAADALRRLPPYTLLMPSTPGWVEAAELLFGARLRFMDRYRLSADRISPDSLNRILVDSRHRQAIRPIDLPLSTSAWGQDHFLDISIFDSAADFLERGVGFSLSNGDQLAGVAYSSLVCSRGIEISIYVEDAYRRQGIATALASRLLLWCLERGMEPHWDAANPESLKLSMKLGYRALDSYLAYYLVDEE
jgi:GNAT superfamily N-acetyltransferase